MQKKHLAVENFYQFISTSTHFRKIELNEITFVEYNCPIQETILPIWTPHDYLIHVINGRKTWITTEGTTTLSKGDTAFIKKGGHIVQQDFSENFCLLLFFIKDDFKPLLSFDIIPSLSKQGENTENFIVFELANNPSILGYFNSIISYFTLSTPPSDIIAKLKFQELVHVLATESSNHGAISHILSSDREHNNSLRQLMVQNFMYNLSLENYAELCNRSLSSFKRDFVKCFNTSPGRWVE